MKIAKNIASKETIIVSNPKGNGSKGAIVGIQPIFTAIQTAKDTTWKTKKKDDPHMAVKSSEIWVRRDLDLKDLASKERKNCRLLSEAWEVKLAI